MPLCPVVVRAAFSSWRAAKAGLKVHAFVCDGKQMPFAAYSLTHLSAQGPGATVMLSYCAGHCRSCYNLWESCLCRSAAGHLHVTAQLGLHSGFDCTLTSPYMCRSRRLSSQCQRTSTTARGRPQRTLVALQAWMCSESSMSPQPHPWPMALRKRAMRPSWSLTSVVAPLMCLSWR